jgi:2-polyprenyl-3-methyl-5-hydroxy-6-metoxy-1,4-benzoquinol methylase
MSDPLTTVERDKYVTTWRDPVYRQACHSLHLWRTRRDLFPAGFRSAIDLGCGLGHLIAEWNRDGIDAWGFDIADNCLDESVSEEWGRKVVIGCLWEMGLGRRFDLGVCTDVMEHIPTDRVTLTLECIAAHCTEVLFKIAHSPNVLGHQVLHLTLESYGWWMHQMEAVGGDAEYLGVQMRSGFKDSLIRWFPRGARC